LRHNRRAATRLEDLADSIENPGAHEAEQDIRAAAARLREIDNPTPLIPRLVGELTKLATFSSGRIGRPSWRKKMLRSPPETRSPTKENPKKEG